MGESFLRTKVLSIMIIIFFVSLNFQSVIAEPVLEVEPYTDELSDGVDFNECLNNDNIIPKPITLDVDGVTFGVDESQDDAPILRISATMVEPVLPDASYTWEFAFDVDKDPSTGISEPLCFYNGLGVEFDVGVQVSMGLIVSSWIDVYESGEWQKISEPKIIIEDNILHIEFPLETIGLPLDTKLMVYLISEGTLDQTPNFGEPPIELKYYYLPQIIIRVPEKIDEGTSFELDASESTSLNGPIIKYDWDMDGDGVFEKSLTDSSLNHVYIDNNIYEVSLKVTDDHGFSSTEMVLIEVNNLPPTNPRIESSGALVVGEVLEFTGSAEDLGDDELSYLWDLGDGTTVDGQEVSHIYTEIIRKAENF
jgi:hypothetical protein